MASVPDRTKRQAAEGRAERIRSSAEETWRLVLEAYSLKDWLTLGYGSWAGYCEREFGMTDRNARYVLGQAEVVTEIEAVVGIGLPTGTVSLRGANEIRPVLPAVLDDVKAAVKGKPKVKRPAIAKAIVDEARAERKQFPVGDEKPLPDKGRQSEPIETSAVEKPSSGNQAVPLDVLQRMSRKSVEATVGTFTTAEELTHLRVAAEKAGAWCTRVAVAAGSAIRRLDR